MSISVIIPSFNEEKNIQDTVNSCLIACREAGLDAEFICIDDCSTDRTPILLNEIALHHSEVTFIRNEKNLGFGGSFWKGLETAKKDNVVVIPGDNENNLAEIIQYYDYLKFFDMVVPYPTNTQKRAFIRRVVSTLYLKIVNFTFRVNFRYTNGTILYKTSLLKAQPIKVDSFMFQTVNLVMLTRHGATFKEVPYMLNEDCASKKSSTLKLKTIVSVISSYFRLFSYLEINRFRKYFKKV